MNQKIQKVVLAAGAAAVVIGFLWYTQRPVRVVDTAVTALAEAKSGAFGATIELNNPKEAASVLGEPGKVDVTLDGVFIKGTEGQARDRLQAEVVIATKSESVALTVEGEIRFVDDNAYVLIKKAPPGALSQLRGTWLELPRGAASQGTAAAVPEDLFTDVKRVGTDTIGDTSVVKYTAVAREAAVVRMMDGIAELLGTRLTDAQVAEIKGSVQKAGQIPVELMIARWGSDLKQLAANVAVPGGNAMRLVLHIKELNPKVEITAPEKAVPVSEAAAALQQQAVPK